MAKLRDTGDGFALPCPAIIGARSRGRVVKRLGGVQSAFGGTQRRRGQASPAVKPSQQSRRQSGQDIADQVGSGESDSRRTAWARGPLHRAVCRVHVGQFDNRR